jgi:hypothetical protein
LGKVGRNSELGSPDAGSNELRDTTHAALVSTSKSYTEPGHGEVAGELGSGSKTLEGCESDATGREDRGNEGYPEAGLHDLEYLRGFALDSELIDALLLESSSNLLGIQLNSKLGFGGGGDDA